jgi:hypothetical protein
MSDYDVVPVQMPRCLDLPNHGRFTTHEKFIPSMVSGTADEFSRVALLMGSVPWRDPQHFTTFSNDGQPHVSDMVALQFIGAAKEISSGDRGCGVVNPAKIFMGGQCSTCKRGGAPYAIHFAHAVMDKLGSMATRVKLNCSRERKAYPDWNHWRAACLVEASQVLREHCAAGAKEAALAAAQAKHLGLPGEGREVWHREQPCHEQCDGEPGACAQHCGPGGACCRKGFLDALDEPDCGFGNVGCQHGHCCVALSEAYANPAAIAIATASATGGGHHRV